MPLPTIQPPNCACSHEFNDHYPPLRAFSSPPSAGGCKKCNTCTLYHATKKPKPVAAAPQAPPAPKVPPMTPPTTTTTHAQPVTAKPAWPAPGTAQEVAKKAPIRSEQVTDQMLKDIGIPEGKAIALFRFVMENPGCDSPDIAKGLDVSDTYVSTLTRDLLEHDFIAIHLKVVKGERALGRKHFASLDLLRQQVLRKAEEFRRLAEQFA